MEASSTLKVVVKALIVKNYYPSKPALGDTVRIVTIVDGEGVSDVSGDCVAFDEDISSEISNLIHELLIKIKFETNTWEVEVGTNPSLNLFIDPEGDVGASINGSSPHFIGKLMRPLGTPGGWEEAERRLTSGELVRVGYQSNIDMA